jgi:hypothetical protein
LPSQRFVKKFQGRGQSFRARARCDQHDDGSAKLRGNVSGDQRFSGVRQSSNVLMRNSAPER